jgi:hypothetical protein
VYVAALRRADHSSKEFYRLYKKDYGTEEEARAQQRTVEPSMNEYVYQPTLFLFFTYIQEQILLVTRIVVPLSTNKPAHYFFVNFYEYKINLINTFQGVGAEYVQYLLCIARCSQIFQEVSAEYVQYLLCIARCSQIFQGMSAEYVQYLLCIARCFPDISGGGC